MLKLTNKKTTYKLSQTSKNKLKSLKDI